MFPRPGEGVAQGWGTEVLPEPARPRSALREEEEERLPERGRATDSTGSTSSPVRTGPVALAEDRGSGRGRET